MKVSDFDYPLDNQIIAQYPCRIRDQCRLMVLRRETGQIEHKTFEDIPGFIDPGSLLVINDSRVFPARLRGEKRSGGKLEILILKKKDSSHWEALFKGKYKDNLTLLFKGGLKGRLVKALEKGKVLIDFQIDEKNIENHFLKYGEVPIPPYIKRTEAESLSIDSENYQTVYANAYGSVAAPTAGLHFTPKLLKRIRQKGVEIAVVTLHVGLGTFKGISCESVEDHKMETECYSVSEESAKIIRLAKSEKRKIISVGTTTTRVLETISTPEGKVASGNGNTDLFIFPGYSFKIVDALVTNFHLPKSTLLVLASAFAGRERLLRAYDTAIGMGYRFYSYGDAMFIL
ncbi:MAG: tRNA preQ1(34) S-adenosylmethionine ribosyltransferase-isomerase QueA [Nitrospiria bacterium]